MPEEKTIVRWLVAVPGELVHWTKNRTELQSEPAWTLAYGWSDGSVTWKP